MSYTIFMTKQAVLQKDKLDILNSIRQDKHIDQNIKIERLCAKYNISKSTYYRWCKQELNDSLSPVSRRPKSFGNQINPDLKKMIIDVWEFDRTRTIHEIYEFFVTEGNKVSYNTVRKIVLEKLI